MQRFFVCAAVTALVLSQVLTIGAAPPKPLDVIERAIAAYGGAKKLKKSKAAQVEMKGTIENPVKAKVSGNTFLQQPDHLRNELDIDFNGNSVSLVQVYDGKRLWLKVMGKVVEVKNKNALQEMKRNLYVESVGNLISLSQTKYKLSPLGELKIKGKPTIGVRVSSKGQDDVSMYFDAKTFLLAKMEYSTMNAQQMKQINVEKFFSDYKKSNGITMPTRIVMHSDGNPFADLEIVNIQLFDRLDPSLFKKPE